MPRPVTRLRCEPLEDRTTPATITVTTAIDVVDPTDGLTSLREAISQANADPSPVEQPAPVIDFAPGLWQDTIQVGQVGGTTHGPAAFEITRRMEIHGSGQKIARLAAAPAMRLFTLINRDSSPFGVALVVEDVEFVRWSSAGVGGVVYAAPYTALEAYRVTFADNTTVGEGGAIYAHNAGVHISDSTFTGNRALPDATGHAAGGAIRWQTDPSTPTFPFPALSLQQVTIYGNAGGPQVDAALDHPASFVRVYRSILFSPNRPAGVDDLRVVGGGVGEGGKNLIGAVADPALWDVVSTADPQLDPYLKDNGGWTRTYALLPGSPAIDAGHEPVVGLTDQRGAPRTVGNCDLGAFEFGAAVPPLPLPRGPLVVYANDAWLGLAPGTVIADADPTQPGDQPALYGATAFYSLTEAFAAVAPVGGQVYSFGGFSSGFPATVAAGTAYFPGGAGGTEWMRHTSGVTFAPTSVFAVDLNGSEPGTGYDRLFVFGTANIEGAFLQVNGTLPPGGGPFTILTAGEVVGRFAGLPDGATVTAFNGTQYRVRYTATEVILELAPYPGVGNAPPVFAPSVAVPPAPARAIGGAAGQLPEVVVYDANGNELRRFLAYHDAFLGGVHVAVGDVTGDGVADVVTAAGAGGGPHVKVFDGVTFEEVRSFYAFDPFFAGGVSLALGDMTGDGALDVITGAGAGGNPHVRVFDGRTGAEAMSFYAFHEGFGGGVSVAMTAGGAGGLVVAAGPGGGPHVKVFAPVSGDTVASFYAYDPAFTGGVNVAATGGLIMTGTATGAPHAKVFSYSPSLPAPPAELDSFYAGDPNGSTGVRVGVEVTPAGWAEGVELGSPVLSHTLFAIAADGTVTRYTPPPRT
jgi:predicted outer membrane repeat protein